MTLGQDAEFEIVCNAATPAPGRPPGPSPLGLARLLGKSRKEPFRYLPRIAAAYGDVVDLPIPGMTVTLLSHPDHLHHVWVANSAQYKKIEIAQALMFGEPPALPLLHGHEWRRTRLTLSPFFAERAMQQVTGMMLESAVGQIDRWSVYAGTNEHVDLEHKIGSVVMSALLRSMFRYEATDGAVDEWVQMVTDYGAAVSVQTLFYKLPGWIPRPKERSGRAAQTKFMALLDDMIAVRLAEKPDPEKPGDALDVLLAMTFDGTPEMQYRRMRSELAGLVFAGFDTTAEAVAWTLAFLCRTPSAARTAYAEVDALGDAPLCYEHVKELPYLKACFDEAQRLQSAPVNARTATVDDEIGGYHIPAGSHVLIAPIGLQTDPRFWKHPMAYRPERWFTDKINPNAFVPFSSGPRKCMGVRKAYIDGPLILAAILRRYTLQIREGWAPEHVLHTSIGLKGGLPVRLHRR